MTTSCSPDVGAASCPKAGAASAKAEIQLLDTNRQRRLTRAALVVFIFLTPRTPVSGRATLETGSARVNTCEQTRDLKRIRAIRGVKRARRRAFQQIPAPAPNPLSLNHQVSISAGQSWVSPRHRHEAERYPSDSCYRSAPDEWRGQEGAGRSERVLPMISIRGLAIAAVLGAIAIAVAPPVARNVFPADSSRMLAAR